MSKVLQERGSGSLISSIETNLRDHVKSTTTTEEAKKEDDNMPLIQLDVENMDAYHDKDMGYVIVGKPFCRVACVEARRFDGFITIHDGNDNVTYQMARSHPRFKHLFNEECNKIHPLLKLSAQDILEGNAHTYQKKEGFFKRILNLGREYIRNEKMVESLTRGHVSIHEMDYG
ncbi:hypothetical protein Tco_0880998 [Tanacetum coccineum]